MAPAIENVRVYRVEFTDGSHAFAEKNIDGRHEIGHGSISSVAHSVKLLISHMDQKGYSKVGIDFSPFHDIECPNGLTPRRCHRLTEEEQNEFWECFAKA